MLVDPCCYKLKANHEIDPNSPDNNLGDQKRDEESEDVAEPAPDNARMEVEDLPKDTEMSTEKLATNPVFIQRPK
jgi:hypothetical protein